MTSNANKDSLPSPGQFMRWVQLSLLVLDRPASHFLRDEGVEGSKNRVSRLIQNPTALKLDVARRLHCEITDAAKKMKKQLPAMARAHEFMGLTDG